MCNLQKVEDEIHVLLQCPLYDDLRDNLVKNIPNTGMSLIDQYILLLSKTEIQAPLGKCIFRIMERREIFKNIFTNLS